ncbi:MAG TPA: acetylornithine deacetylase [Bradyrhizobium sp.]|uniref:acetylornithine deacetylase n=1 Tax=Bradyrhizobium sp. TaxID=376 RepID=UPI002CC0368E|nr:acetylornithine deacetylase [Bradyrhizobium sp.]HLZ02920.1 acetylornithine deacetylase [Bradyrhizobium sp.]
MDSRSILKELIAFDTSAQFSNLSFVQFVADMLDRPGRRIRIAPGGSGAKANLICAMGPDEEGGIVLSGHSDVVGVAGQSWSSDPFSLREESGRLYGRGTADMKGFIACCLEQMIAVAPDRLRRPILLALSYDEELGCVGVPELVAELLQHFPRPLLAIVGEPTEMKVVSVHKGAFVLRTSFRGRAAHSSNPLAGMNAIDHAHRFMSFLFELAAELKGKCSSSGVEPPYTTLNVGTIEGGTSLNTLAPNCTLTWEFRPIPEIDGRAICARVEQFVDHLRSEMKASIADADIVMERVGTVLPLCWQPKNAAERFIEGLTGSAVALASVPFGTDAGYFQAADIPTVIMGPGSIAQAHQPDEWIAISELKAASDFLSRVVASAAVPS